MYDHEGRGGGKCREMVDGSRVPAVNRYQTTITSPTVCFVTHNPSVGKIVGVRLD